MKTILETDNWRIDTPLNVNDVCQYSKHTAWCTKSLRYASQYFNNGQLYALKKKGRRRYSYQLYCNNSVIELEHKTGTDLILTTFANNEALEIKDFLLSVSKPALDNHKKRRRFRTVGDDQLRTISLTDILDVNVDHVSIESEFSDRLSLCNHSLFNNPTIVTSQTCTIKILANRDNFEALSILPTPFYPNQQRYIFSIPNHYANDCVEIVGSIRRIDQSFGVYQNLTLEIIT